MQIFSLFIQRGKSEKNDFFLKQIDSLDVKKVEPKDHDHQLSRWFFKLK